MSSQVELYKKWYLRWLEAVRNKDSIWCDGSCTDRLQDIKLTEEELKEIKEWKSKSFG